VDRDVPDVPPRPPRLAALLGTKIAVLLGLAVGICVPYFGLQLLDLFPRRTPPALPLDASIPFTPAWLWVYLSVALLVPMLATRRDDLVRYARGLALVCLVCFAAFLLVPIEGPRPAVLPQHGGYEWLTSVDRSYGNRLVLDPRTRRSRPSASRCATLGRGPMKRTSR
jgi:hypothetical protein